MDPGRAFRRRRIARSRAAARDKATESQLGTLCGAAAALIAGAFAAWTTQSSFLVVLPIAAVLGAAVGYVAGPRAWLLVFGSPPV